MQVLNRPASSNRIKKGVDERVEGALEGGDSYEENLVSLCRRCNAKVNFNRDFWEEYFRKEVIKCQS